MLSLAKSKKITILESKITHKSLVLHRLARFVTEEAVCLMLNIQLEDIYVVECWRYIVYVHAKGISKFVSYADFPPIVGVAPPNKIDIIKWRRRWRRQQEPSARKQAPTWWAEFLQQQLWHTFSPPMLNNWEELLNSIEFAFNEITLKQLRSSYQSTVKR